jgi:protein-tyrosine phosphatase
MAYLVLRKGMSLEEALRYVRARRPVIDPTPSYLQQLISFERKTRGVSSISFNEVGDLLLVY